MFGKLMVVLAEGAPGFPKIGAFGPKGFEVFFQFAGIDHTRGLQAIFRNDISIGNLTDHFLAHEFQRVLPLGKGVVDPHQSFEGAEMIDVNLQSLAKGEGGFRLASIGLVDKP